jgi:hypothetical protein
MVAGGWWREIRGEASFFHQPPVTIFRRFRAPLSGMSESSGKWLDFKL